MADTIRKVRAYFSSDKPFLVPYYQRGYVWGKSNADKEDTVRTILASILEGYRAGVSMFLQGITVSEGAEYVEIIDGQQRTVFLYLLLRYLGVDLSPVKYQIRQDTEDYLKAIDPHRAKAERDLHSQEQYYIALTCEIIREKLSGIEDREGFRDYILDKISLLYVNIPDARQAVSVFTMMNGGKAVMKGEELLKAELLRVASMPSGSPHESERSCMQLRARYAREWDRWLYWWRQDEVVLFFRTRGRMLGWLVPICTGFVGLEGRGFERVRQTLLADSKQAKRLFDLMRRVQKKCEELYKDYKSYNHLGAILLLLDEKTLEQQFIRDLFSLDREAGTCTIRIDLEEYYKWIFIEGLTHDQICRYIDGRLQTTELQEYRAIVDDVRQRLANRYLYEDDDLSPAYRQLLRRNIDEDTRLARSFDFSIWDNRSLEHIHPKSKAQMISRRGKALPAYEGLSQWIHSIGNLVLLDRHNNSQFSNSDFREKKAIYFRLLRDSTTSRSGFASLKLLHSIKVFASDDWQVSDIKDNYYDMLDNYKKTYLVRKHEGRL